MGFVNDNDDDNNDDDNRDDEDDYDVDVVVVVDYMWADYVGYRKRKEEQRLAYDMIKYITEWE